MTGGSVSVEDAAAIHELIAQWAWLLDHGRAGELVDLLTPDGQVLGFGPDPVDRAGVAAWAAARPTDRRTRHQCTNTQVRERPDGRLEAHSVLVLHVVDASGGPRIEFVGSYDDVIERGEDGAWRFASRSLSAI